MNRKALPLIILLCLGIACNTQNNNAGIPLATPTPEQLIFCGDLGSRSEATKTATDCEYLNARLSTKSSMLATVNTGVTQTISKLKTVYSFTPTPTITNTPTLTPTPYLILPPSPKSP